MNGIVYALKEKLINSKISELDRYNQSHVDSLRDLFNSALTKQRSSSIIINGRRFCGKSIILRNAIKSIEDQGIYKNKYIVCNLSGVLHSDDKIAMRALIDQINQKSFLKKFSQSSSFPTQLQILMNDLKGFSMALFIIIDEFDLFVAHKNQTLLYNLLELVHSGIVPIVVVGLTSRIDILELLEKRVKSRFSHRLIYLTSPLQAVLERDEMLKKLMMSFFEVKSSDVPSKYALTKSSLNSWNEHIERIFSDENVLFSVRQLLDYSINTKVLFNLMSLIISQVSESDSNIEVANVLDAISIIRKNSKYSLINSLSTLEQILLTVIIKLHDICLNKAVNFQRIYNAYVDFCRNNNGSTYIYEKAIILKIIDNLIDQKFIVQGKNARDCVVYSKGIYKSATQNLLNNESSLVGFEPIVAFVSQDTCKHALSLNPYCPSELRQWLHSRTF